MNGCNYIKAKQQNWAKRQGFELFGGTKPNRGEKNYLDDLSSNIFNQHLSKETQKNFDEGDGNETKDSKTRLAKMKAVHSSSALPVNVFQYWQYKDVMPILHACKLTRNKPQVFTKNRTSKIKFEQKFEISPDKNLFPRSPNLDVVIEDGNILYAIESKFTEPYSKKPEGLSERYINDETFWNGIPNLYQLAKENKKFEYLDASQLLKHILGLKKNSEKSEKIGFYLLYIWYDVIAKEREAHIKEIELFAEIAKKDGIKFRHITYQEVIVNLSDKFYDSNSKYIDYLTNRYL